MFLLLIPIKTVVFHPSPTESAYVCASFPSLTNTKAGNP